VPSGLELDPEKKQKQILLWWVRLQCTISAHHFCLDEVCMERYTCLWRWMFGFVNHMQQLEMSTHVTDIFLTNQKLPKYELLFSSCLFPYFENIPIGFGHFGSSQYWKPCRNFANKIALHVICCNNTFARLDQQRNRSNDSNNIDDCITLLLQYWLATAKSAYQVIIVIIMMILLLCSSNTVLVATI